jgi:hypothetical protein
MKLTSIENEWIEILNLDPDVEYKITYSAVEEWEKCYFQNKNESNTNVDPKNLPILDDDYYPGGDFGNGLYNEDYEPVYDPTQEIHYESTLKLKFERVFSSKTLVKLLQNKIKELIDSDDSYLEIDSDGNELAEALEINHTQVFIEDLAYMSKCNDLVELEKSGPADDLLWFLAAYLDCVWDAKIQFDPIEN